MAIQALGENTQSVTAFTMNSETDHGTQAQIAFAMVDADVDVLADVRAGTTVSAGGSLTVTSSLEQSLSASASAGAFKDGVLGAAVGITDADVSTIANVGGSVTASGDMIVDATQNTCKNDTAASSGVGATGTIQTTLIDFPARQPCSSTAQS